MDQADSSTGPHSPVAAEKKRKRNATACQICRSRKTKCDSKRPRCSYCVSIGAACDVEIVQQTSFPFSPDTAAILQRLDRLETTLQQGQSLHFLPSNPQISLPGDGDRSPVRQSRTAQYADGRVSFYTVESVLSWAVFGAQHKALPGLRELMTEGNVLENFSPQPGRNSSLVSFELDACSRLLDNFFSRIHIKNPVLDENEVRKWAREIAFHGVGWDARSCLVLLVCALGAISASFDDDGHNTQAFRDSDDHSLAKAWFAASQKRIGPVVSRGGGVLETQCLFFTGVYLMHIFRPFAAWPLFLQALAFCQSFKCSSSGNLPQAPAEFVADTLNWHSEESLYWTCFKSELEFRLDLSLPGFTATDLSYPEFLPSPPPAAIRTQDQSWYFYLAEIALRRLANSILTEVLPLSNPQRSTHLREYAAMVPSFENQAENWSQLLPPEVDINTSGQDDVLRFILRGHLLNCDEAMYWPFIVQYINFPTTRDFELDHFVKKGLQVCVDRIWVNESGFHHRHHGTWGTMRSCTRSALVLIAAKKCGQLEELIPIEWDSAVSKVIGFLDFWSGECGDAMSRRDVLQAGLQSI